MSHHPIQSPLATLETCFRLLCTQPGALTIDSHLLQPGPPHQPVPLDDLRSRFPQLDPHSRLAVLTVLVRPARTGSAAWKVGLAGILLPGLRYLAAQQAQAPTTGAEARAITWFRATLTAPTPEADRRIRWLLDATCATHAARASGPGGWPAMCEPQRSDTALGEPRADGRKMVDSQPVRRTSRVPRRAAGQAILAGSGGGRESNPPGGGRPPQRF
jgi:hypothetical protein